MKYFAHVRHACAAVMLLVGAQVFGQAAGCALEGCSLFKEADTINDPHDDANLWRCRVYEQVSFGMDHDAGGAWKIYDDCVRDAGLR